MTETEIASETDRVSAKMKQRVLYIHAVRRLFLLEFSHQFSVHWNFAVIKAKSLCAQWGHAGGLGAVFPLINFGTLSERVFSFLPHALYLQGREFLDTYTTVGWVGGGGTLGLYVLEKKYLDLPARTAFSISIMRTELLLCWCR